MIKLFPILTIISIFLTGCSSFTAHQIRISDKYYTEQILGTSDYYKEGTYHQKKNRRYYHIRYLLTVDEKSSDAAIVNKAVEHAQNGNYREAMILLKQVSSSFNGIVANNIGVLHEIGGDKAKAQTYYFKACKMDSSNRYFAKNFNSL